MHHKIDPDVIENEIRKRAYKIYLQKGEEGNDISNWLQAEREIFSEYNISRKDMDTKRMGNRKKYIDKLSAQLKILDNEIEKLQTKASVLKDDSKVKYENLINELNFQKKNAQKKIQELKSSSVESLEVLKEGSEKIWSEMKKTFENSVSKFKHEN